MALEVVRHRAQEAPTLITDLAQLVFLVATVQMPAVLAAQVQQDQGQHLDRVVVLAVAESVLPTRRKVEAMVVKVLENKKTLPTQLLRLAVAVAAAEPATLAVTEPGVAMAAAAAGQVSLQQQAQAATARSLVAAEVAAALV